MKNLAPLALAVTLSSGSAVAEHYTIYIGTYTGQKSQGIYQASFDAASGKLGQPVLAVATPSPSFLALHPTKPLLYAVGEGSSIGPKKEGAVTSFRMSEAGQLEQLNHQPSGGSGPCHVSIDPSGQCVMVANYGSGSVASYPVAEDGKLRPAASVIQHEGSSVNPRRQSGPHAHQIVTDPSGRFAYVCDLGLDQILVYKLNAAEGRLEKHNPPFATVPAGAGARHLAFHPSGKHLFVVNEMGSSVTGFHVDGPAGSLKSYQTLTTLPGEFKGDNSCAEIEVHPSGKFLYASNRGHNSIAVFGIESDGALSPVQHEPSGGKTPRFFALDPPGKWLLAANQDSDNITVLSVDPDSGKLRASGQSIEVGKPVCIVFRKTPRR